MAAVTEYTEEELAYYMGEAYKEAQIAFSLGEVPVGAVIVWDGEIVSRGHNSRETDKNALRHAELSAIDGACAKLGGWRLHKADLFVTLEPCVMCAGACVTGRIRRVYYGAADIRFGGFGGVVDLRGYGFNHIPEVRGGIMEEPCAELMRRFFRELRKNGG
ncbi:MAG: nucleoside deaminase [Clostridia bacterium]|nr:nucleoside deaminase [Clostridia bacterium]